MGAGLSGYTKSYRDKWTNPVFRNLLEVGIWSWMCDTAVWEEERLVRFNMKLIKLKRGQVPVSERFIAEGFGIGRQVVRTLLSNLLANHMVTQEITQGVTILSICNYDKYQCYENQGNPVDFANQPAYPTKYKEIKKEITPQKYSPKGELKSPPKIDDEGEEDGGKKINLSRLPYADLPQEWEEWAHAAMGLRPVVIPDVWANFRDYWQAKRGKSAYKSDWLAVWRNWCRKEAPQLRKAGSEEASIPSAKPQICSCGKHFGVGQWSPKKRAETYAWYREKHPARYDSECKNYLDSYESVHGRVSIKSAEKAG